MCAMNWYVWDELIKVLFCLLFFSQIGSKVPRLKVKKCQRSEENRRNEINIQKNGMNGLWKHNMTTGVNEHKFRVKLVSISMFLQACARKQKGRGLRVYVQLLLQSKQDGEVKLSREYGKVKSTYPISFCLFSSGFMLFSLFLIQKEMAYFTPLRNVVNF